MLEMMLSSGIANVLYSWNAFLVLVLGVIIDIVLAQVFDPANKSIKRIVLVISFFVALSLSGLIIYIDSNCVCIPENISTDMPLSQVQDRIISCDLRCSREDIQLDSLAYEQHSQGIALDDSSYYVTNISPLPGTLVKKNSDVFLIVTWKSNNTAEAGADSEDSYTGYENESSSTSIISSTTASTSMTVSTSTTVSSSTHISSSQDNGTFVPEKNTNSQEASRNEKVHVRGEEFYGRSIWKNITAANYTLAIGSTNHFSLEEEGDKLCRKFELMDDGSLSLVFSYYKDRDRKINASQSAQNRDTDDWIITIVSGNHVIYKGYVSRKDNYTSFQYNLSKGTYFFVAQRLSGNSEHWYMTIDTDFHVN